MKKHFTPQPIIGSLNLSIEEEAILLDELGSTMVDQQTAGEATARLMDTNEIISHTQEIAATVPELGSAEEQLLSAVSEMAVAGTDANPDDVLKIEPNSPISVEGFFDTLGAKLKEIWAKIMEMIVKAWEGVKKFFGLSNMHLEVSKKKLEVAEETYKEAKAAPAKAAEPIKPTKPAKPKREQKPFVFRGTPGNISINGTPVAPEKLAGEVRRMTAAVKKGVAAIKIGWPAIYDNVKNRADTMTVAIKSQNDKTYEDFLASYTEGGASHRKLFEKMVHDGGFHEEGKEDKMLANFNFLFKLRDSHSDGWNDGAIWVDSASGLYNAPTDGIKEIPMDHIEELLKACREGLDVAMEFDDVSDINELIDRHKKAAEDAMKHLSEIKPSQQTIDDEQDAVKSLSLGVIAGRVQQLGYATFKAAEFAFVIGRSCFSLCKVTDTACHYAEISVNPY